MPTKKRCPARAAIAPTSSNSLDPHQTEMISPEPGYQAFSSSHGGEALPKSYRTGREEIGSSGTASHRHSFAKQENRSLHPSKLSKNLSLQLEAF
jgi:hypothetical protein